MFASIKDALAAYDAVYAKSPRSADVGLRIALALITHANEHEMLRRVRTTTLIGIPAQAVIA